MSLILMGAEIPSNRTLLTAMGATTLGVGFKGLTQRVNGTEDTLLRNYDDDLILHAYPGIGGVEMTLKEHRELAERYERFIDTNRDRLASWVEYDSMELGPAWITERREQFYDKYDEQCFRPVWKKELGTAALKNLSDQYPHVAVSQSSLADQPGIVGTMRQLVNEFETSFHVLSANQLDMQGPFDQMYTFIWASPMMHGSTVVWHNNRLVRHPKQRKENRADYRAIIEEAGLDYDEILADKPRETTKLAIWSVLQFEKHGSPSHLSVISTNKGAAHPAYADGPDTDLPANSDQPVRHQPPLIPTARNPQERGFLPSVGVESMQALVSASDGTKTFEDVPIVTSKGGSVRHCNTCFVSATCPAMKPDHECAFSLPVEIKTKDQLISLMQAMIEMQASRVAFARYAESLNGDYPDITVSKEMDRLFSQVKSLKKLEEESSTVKMTVQATSSAGVLSNIFGERATQALTASVRPEEDS